MSRSTSSYQSCRDAAGTGKGCPSRGCAAVRAAECQGVCEKFGVGGVNAWGRWIRAAMGWNPPAGALAAFGSLRRGWEVGGRDGARVAAPGDAGAGALE